MNPTDAMRSTIVSADMGDDISDFKSHTSRYETEVTRIDGEGSCNLCSSATMGSLISPHAKVKEEGKREQKRNLPQCLCIVW